MASLYQLPDELLLSVLSEQFPCREQQTRALATLLDSCAAPCRNLVVYGTEATGKTAVVSALLEHLGRASEGDSFKHAIVNSVECITARHLFERTVGKVANVLEWQTTSGRCENLSQLTHELSKMLKYAQRPDGWRFVLVFDAIDCQREAPSTLLPALARLTEIIPCLTTVFIVTSPPPNFLRTSFVPYVHFPSYTNAEFVKILSTTPPERVPAATEQETAELWARFCGAVHDALTKAAARTLPAFQHACLALWPRFIAPIKAGTHGPREFSKLLVASRVHFQDESLLDPGVIAARPTASQGAVNGMSRSDEQKALAKPTGPNLSVLLPTVARMLLLAAYLASHNAARHDLTLFSTYHHGKRKRRGGGLSVAGAGTGRMGPRSKHRKIARKLLGPHAFVMERMMAIFTAVRSEWGAVAATANGMDADVGMAIATLSSLRLLVRVGGGGDPMDRGGKWRVNVGWEVVRGLGRSIGVEVEEWLVG